MTADIDEREAGHPVLLCFDGSDDAAAAIAQAAELLASRRAVVLTVWEPVATWESYDPATILSAPVSKLLSRELGIDEVAAELAEEKVKRGVALASSGGADGRRRRYASLRSRARRQLRSARDPARRRPDWPAA